jgi:segregation and condensation protein B
MLGQNPHRFAGQALSRSGKPTRTAAAQLSGARPAGANRRLRPNVPLGMEAAGKKSGVWRRRLDARGPQIAAVPDPHARDAGTARLEAVLFLAREPINTRKLAQLAHLADGTEARTLIRRLNRWYDETGSAFVAEELAGGFQLLSRPQFGGWLRRLYGGPADIRLSAPALETLAVVAYRQPVMRSEIEAIRGVDCGEILRQLMDRNLVRAAGRAEELGRPYLYATTKRFLQVFGLKHLDDLPRAALLRPNPESAAPAGASTSANPSRPREIHES